jgi:hypothetical protein
MIEQLEKGHGADTGNQAQLKPMARFVHAASRVRDSCCRHETLRISFLKIIVEIFPPMAHMYAFYTILNRFFHAAGRCARIYLTLSDLTDRLRRESIKGKGIDALRENTPIQ